jgi:hypothetical protein
MPRYTYIYIIGSKESCETNDTHSKWNILGVVAAFDQGAFHGFTFQFIAKAYLVLESIRRRSRSRSSHDEDGISNVKQ